MTNKIDEINSKLKKLLEQGWTFNREDLFNLGVELGKQLSIEKVDSFRLDAWIDIEKQNHVEAEIRNAVKKIEDFLTMLVRLSIAQHIKESGSWSIAKGGGYGLERFSHEIVTQFNVQVLHCDMESYDGEFIVGFEVTDDLAVQFNKHNIYNQFDVRIYNDNGEEEQTLYDIKKIDSWIHGVNAHIKNSNNWELSEYVDFYHQISKPFLFIITKYIT